MSTKQLQSVNYRLLGLVGQGQFGQVYCAAHRKTGRLAALKNINRDRLPTHRFLRELRFLLSLEHPNIANCHALEQSATGRQLVLDYCEGGTLRDLMEQEVPLSLAEILTLITEVLTALEHAQRKGIVHCDIKPENILLTISPTGWHAKVSDFGIARLSEELRGDRTGATGSPAYMAPERFYFQSSIGSDLYAVGVVLYELLVGDRPFSGSYKQLMVAHLNHAVKVPETLPGDVRSLLFKSLEKLSARRFRRATDMQSSLLAARQGLTAGELRERFPKPYGEIARANFSPQHEKILPHLCQTLALTSFGKAKSVLLAASEQTVVGWEIADETALKTDLPSMHWNFEHPIAKVTRTATGPLAVSEKAIYRVAPDQPPQHLASFTVPVRLAEHTGRWLITQSTLDFQQFWLIDSRGHLPEKPRHFGFNSLQGNIHPLMLDDRHLLLADVTEQQTNLHVLTRWGKPLGCLRLQASVRQLFPSQRPLQFLAQLDAAPQDFLVIRVKPYRVMRCRLDIAANWLGELVVGYVAISRNGKMQIVNFQGQLIGTVEGLPVPRAIAFQPPHRLWLATDAEDDPKLHGIDIRNLPLDIIF